MLVHAVAKPHPELGVLAELSVEESRRVARRDLLELLPPGGVGLNQGNVGDFLVPNEELESLTFRPTPASCPPVMIGPVIGAGINVEDHVVDEVVYIEVLRKTGVASAIWVVPLKALIGWIRPEAGGGKGHHLAPRLSTAGLHLRKVLERVILLLLSAEVLREKLIGRPLGEMVE